MDKTICIKIWTMSENTERAALLLFTTLTHWDIGVPSLVIDAGKIMCTVWSQSIWVSVYTSENSATKDTVIIYNTFGKSCVYECVTNSASQCELLHFILSQGDQRIYRYNRRMTPAERTNFDRVSKGRMRR